MDFNFGNSRPRTVQESIQFRRIVRFDTPTVVSEEFNADRLITSFSITNWSSNPYSVILRSTQHGPALDSPGIEIPPGTTPIFVSFQEGRQLYELQILSALITSQQAKDLIRIPVIVWDMTRWWLIGKPPADGSLPTVTEMLVSVTAFPLPYL